MKSLKKIIDLIERGDPIAILAEDSLKGQFNELLRHRLIDVVNEKVILTKKGEEARALGIDKVIPHLNNQDKQKAIPPEIQNAFRLIKWSLGICITLLGLFIAAILTEFEMNL